MSTFLPQEPLGWAWQGRFLAAAPGGSREVGAHKAAQAGWVPLRLLS